MTLSWLLLLALTADPPSRSAALICCGDREVFILPQGAASADEAIWSWSAADSPEIAPEHRDGFRKTTECKPFGDSILVTASTGGVALVRRGDKRCLFQARVQNAHSACLLPGDRLAVASSNGGDELLVFALGDPAEPARPLARHPLRSAHGVVWDGRRLWALGYSRLWRFALDEPDGEVRLLPERSWDLPTPGGHDLSLVDTDEPGDTGEPRFYVTTETAVYTFAARSGAFVLDERIGRRAEVKSVDPHSESGAVVYLQGVSRREWWSDTIRFRGGRAPIVLPGARLYKVRWDVPR